MLSGPAAYVAHDNHPNCEFKRNSGRIVELQVSDLVSTYMVLISWPSKVVRPINCHQLITAKYGADKESPSCSSSTRESAALVVPRSVRKRWKYNVHLSCISRTSFPLPQTFTHLFHQEVWGWRWRPPLWYFASSLPAQEPRKSLLHEPGEPNYVS